MSEQEPTAEETAIKICHEVERRHGGILLGQMSENLIASALRTARLQGAAQEREGVAFDSKTDEMIVYAFRYCLGRATYVTANCADYLIANWDRLSQHSRGMILNEITRAFEEKRYGHDTDRDEWERVLNHGTVRARAAQESEG